MKIVFFSDIHGNIYSFEAFLKKMKEIKPDKMIFCGDVFGYYYYHNEIFCELRQNKIASILGNHEKMLMQVRSNNIDVRELVKKYGEVYNRCDEVTNNNMDFISSLDEKLEVCIDDIKFGVFHGSPNDYTNERIYPDTLVTDYGKYDKYDYVILGHTHHKMVRKFNNTIVINPGSLGQPRDGKGCSYLLFDTQKRNFSFEVIKYDVRKLLDDIDRNDNGNKKLKELILRKR